MKIHTYIGHKVLDKYHKNHDQIVTFFLSFNSKKSFSRIYLDMLANRFIDQGQKVIVLQIYSTIRLVCRAMCYLARRWRWKVARRFNLDTDLYMNSLDNFPSTQKIQFLQLGTLYTFRVTDILNIWKKALEHSIAFSPTPQMPKNPYINVPFDRGHLATCYQHMKDTAFSVPVMIEMFWKASMDMQLFLMSAYPFLKEASIKNHLEDSSEETLYFDIMNMISSLREELDGARLRTDLSNSDRQRTVCNLKPYLYLYLYGTLSCNPVKRRTFRTQAVSELIKFFRKRPEFLSVTSSDSSDEDEDKEEEEKADILEDEDKEDFPDDPDDASYNEVLDDTDDEQLVFDIAVDNIVQDLTRAREEREIALPPESVSASDDDGVSGGML